LSAALIEKIIARSPMLRMSEGGNAVGAVDRIPKANVLPTIEAFVKFALETIPYKAFAPIGSTGKKTDNGDIDLALDTPLSLQEIGKVMEQLGISHVVNTGLGEVSCRFPQYDSDYEETEQWAQIDLMVGPLDWLEFCFYVAPQGQTRFKPMVQKGILYGLLRYGPSPEPQTDGSIIQWSMSTTRGIMKKKGTPRVNRNGKEVIDWVNVTDYEPSPERFMQVAFERASRVPHPDELMASPEEMIAVCAEVLPEDIMSKFSVYLMQFCKDKEVEAPDLNAFVLPEDMQSLTEGVLTEMVPLTGSVWEPSRSHTPREKITDTCANCGKLHKEHYPPMAGTGSMERTCPDRTGRKFLARRVQDEGDEGWYDFNPNIQAETRLRFPTPEEAELAAKHRARPNKGSLDFLSDKIRRQEGVAILFEGTDVLITGERNHGTHAEDMVLYGPEGLDFTLSTYRDLLDEFKGHAEGKRNVSTKIDGCFAPPTLIKTSKGLMPIIEAIKRVQGGESLDVHARDLDTGLDTITPILAGMAEPGEKAWVRVTLAGGGSFECTEDHLIYTKNRGYVAAKDLSVKDELSM
jgi:hypothetical protein